jgi:hypothetical protein
MKPAWTKGSNLASEAGFCCLRHRPNETNLIKGSQRTRKWKNWLPSAILINLLEKRKDN